MLSRFPYVYCTLDMRGNWILATAVKSYVLLFLLVFVDWKIQSMQKSVCTMYVLDVHDACDNTHEFC